MGVEKKRERKSFECVTKEKFAKERESFFFFFSSKFLHHQQ